MPEEIGAWGTREVSSSQGTSFPLSRLIASPRDSKASRATVACLAIASEAVRREPKVFSASPKDPGTSCFSRMRVIIRCPSADSPAGAFGSYFPSMISIASRFPTVSSQGIRGEE